MSCLLSVIIPVYNRGDVLRNCLEAVFADADGQTEIIVVDDGSTDNTADVAREFPCRLICNESQKGRGFSRNIGAKDSCGDILVLIDSDAVISPGTIQAVRDVFKNDPEAAAATGLPRAENPCQGFVSHYKSLYMNFIFGSLPQQVDFLHGSLSAFRRTVFTGDDLPLYDEELYCDDIDMGLQLSRAGKKIVFCPKMSFVHLKYLRSVDLLVNDFIVSTEFAYLMFRNHAFWKALRDGRFAHTSLRQVICVAMTAVAVLLLFAGIVNLKSTTSLITISCAILLFQAVINWRFYLFLFKKKGFFYMLTAVPFTIVDQVVHASGIIYGTVSYFLNIRQNRSLTI